MVVIQPKEKQFVRRFLGNKIIGNIIYLFGLQRIRNETSSLQAIIDSGIANTTEEAKEKLERFLYPNYTFRGSIDIAEWRLERLESKSPDRRKYRLACYVFD